MFDDPQPQEQLTPPTLEEFWAEVGDPVLSFKLEEGNVNVPKGILNCCRVVHQVQCEHHVAGSIVGVFYTISFADGRSQERRPDRQSYDGDVLARPLELSAAVQVVTLMAAATADAQGGKVSEMTFHVWTLNLLQQEMWRYLKQQVEADRLAAIGEADDLTPPQIEALPIKVIVAQDGPPVAVASLMAREDFVIAAGYADRVTILPGELGHDAEARYVLSEVWGQEGDLPPAVEALRTLPDDDNEAQEAEERTCSPMTAQSPTGA